MQRQLLPLKCALAIRCQIAQLAEFGKRQPRKSDRILNPRRGSGVVHKSQKAVRSSALPHGNGAILTGSCFGRTFELVPGPQLGPQPSPRTCPNGEAVGNVFGAETPVPLYRRGRGQPTERDAPAPGKCHRMAWRMPTAWVSSSTPTPFDYGLARPPVPLGSPHASAGGIFSSWKPRSSMA